MELILDTNVLINITIKPEKLTDKAIKSIFSAQSRCYISTVSLWEIAIKKQVGKLEMSSTMEELIATIKAYDFNLMAIPPVLINTYQNLPLHHRDPFDRMIIAHALRNNYTVITSDKHFTQYGVKTIW